MKLKVRRKAAVRTAKVRTGGQKRQIPPITSGAGKNRLPRNWRDRVITARRI